jgi:hypothetical protein
MEPNGLAGSTLSGLQAALRERARRQLKKYPRLHEAIRSVYYKDARAWRRQLIEGYPVRFVILLYPLVMQDRFYKGVLWIMGNASCVVKRYPDIKNYFFLISTASGSKQWATGRVEDIHGLTLDAPIDEYVREFPGSSCMVIRNADFLDEKDFYPLDVEKEYDIFFNSALWKVKRHELFLSTLYDLRKRYRRDLKAVVILWSGNPRLQNSIIYPKLFYRMVRPFLREKEMREYARHIRGLYEEAIKDGFHIKLVDPMYRWEKGTIENLRLFYNKSRIYLLLSKTEGLNRAAKEALLCNTPVMVIKGSTTAIEFVNSQTGKAVEDEQKDISEGILHMLDRQQLYSPRSWALKHCPRMQICNQLWEKINALQKVPGYPNIHEANKIRQSFTPVEHDNYLDLNNWRGVGSSGSLAREMRWIRAVFSKHVGSE